MDFWAGGKAEMESVQGFRVSEVCAPLCRSLGVGGGTLGSVDDGADIASGVVEPGICIVSTFTTTLGRGAPAARVARRGRSRARVTIDASAQPAHTRTLDRTVLLPEGLYS